ncbi:hypothetical protein [Flavobacterium sp.]|uniref:hypothetical protein n=1 Tax=Flavobacterium sp. TaxID=239 RepID=UPI002584B4FD|nr:hypothetical protein [Flavobacterium sp.]
MLIGMVWSLVSCTADELEMNTQNSNSNNSFLERDSEPEPKPDWGKGGYNNSNPPSNEGGN